MCACSKVQRTGQPWMLVLRHYSLVFDTGSLTGPALNIRLGWLTSKTQESASLYLPSCHDLRGFWIDLTVLTVAYTEKLGSGGLCTLMAMHSQPRNSAYLLYTANQEGGIFYIYSWISVVSGYSYPESSHCGWYFLHTAVSVPKHCGPWYGHAHVTSAHSFRLFTQGFVWDYHTQISVWALEWTLALYCLFSPTVKLWRALFIICEILITEYKILFITSELRLF